MPTYVFPGFPGFLESAAHELGHRESAGNAGRISAVASVANLCAQASLADFGQVPEILARASRFRDQLAVAQRAVELMIADVEAGRTRSIVQSSIAPEVVIPPTPSPDARRNRKGPSTFRESS